MALLDKYVAGLGTLLKDLSKTSLQQESLLNACTQFCVDQFEAAFARIWLLEKDGKTLVLKSSSGMYTALDGTRSRITIGQGSKIDSMFVSGASHISNDVINDPQVLDKEWVKNTGLVSFAGYPLTWGNQKYGVLGMYSKNILSDELLQIMEVFIPMVSSGIYQRSQYEKNIAQFCNVSGLELGLVQKMMMMADD